MFTFDLINMINAIFNMAQLLLLLMIFHWCMREKTRADRLEESNRKLTNRFVRFVMKMPLEYRINVEDIESDRFDRSYPPLETEDESD